MFSILKKNGNEWLIALNNMKNKYLIVLSQEKEN